MRFFDRSWFPYHTKLNLSEEYIGRFWQAKEDCHPRISAKSSLVQNIIYILSGTFVGVSPRTFASHQRTLTEHQWSKTNVRRCSSGQETYKNISVLIERTIVIWRRKFGERSTNVRGETPTKVLKSLVKMKNFHYSYSKLV
jgi:hypothetical protein